MQRRFGDKGLEVRGDPVRYPLRPALQLRGNLVFFPGDYSGSWWGEHSYMDLHIVSLLPDQANN